MTSLFLTILFLVGIEALGVVAADSGEREPYIVTAAWLAEHIDDPSLVLLHVGDKSEYDSAHIPGAQFISRADISTPQGQGLTLELPSVEQLDSTFENLGISNHSRIILYFGKDWVSPTARVYLTLEYIGMGERTSILDGGMPAWRREGRPLTNQIRPPKRGNIIPALHTNVIADAQYVMASLQNPNVAILDARTPNFYEGKDPGMASRSGRIPGARSIPFTTVLDDSNRFKNIEALRDLFTSQRVEEEERVVTYCHIGQQASLLYFIARYLGYDARMYDGSFEDWTRREELPVETSAPTNKD